MDNQQQQRMNRAAQEFTDALVAAYKTTSDSTVVAQQLGAQQIEYFFDGVINNLRTQGEGTLQLTQQLADQHQLARECAQDLAQMSTDNYLELLDSMFSFYQGATSRTQSRTEETQRRVEEAEARAEEAQVRAEEAERTKSEAENHRDAQEADNNAEALHRPQSQWVRTSGRSKVRARNRRSRGRSSSHRR
jgi:hypothetical protein